MSSRNNLSETRQNFPSSLKKTTVQEDLYEQDDNRDQKTTEKKKSRSVHFEEVDQPLALVEIEAKDGQVFKIALFEDSDSRNLAQLFGKKQNLNQQQVKLIEQTIEQEKQKALKKLQKGNKNSNQGNKKEVKKSANRENMEQKIFYFDKDRPLVDELRKWHKGEIIILDPPSSTNHQQFEQQYNQERQQQIQYENHLLEINQIEQEQVFSIQPEKLESTRHFQTEVSEFPSFSNYEPSRITNYQFNTKTVATTRQRKKIFDNDIEDRIRHLKTLQELSQFQRATTIYNKNY